MDPDQPNLNDKEALDADLAELIKSGKVKEGWATEMRNTLSPKGQMLFGLILGLILIAIILLRIYFLEPSPTVAELVVPSVFWGYFGIYQFIDGAWRYFALD